MRDYYVFRYDGIAWVADDTIWQTHEDAEVAIMHRWNDPEVDTGIIKACIAISENGSFPRAYWTWSKDA